MFVRQSLTDLTRRLAARPWSRAGAVARILAAGTPRRAVGLAARMGLLVGGSLVLGLAIGTMLWNDFGPGPLDVFISALHSATGLPLAVAAWAAAGGLMLIALALGRRPGIGTIAAPLMIGPVMQLTLAGLGRFEPSESLGRQLLVHALAIGAAGFGAGALIVSGLGAGTGELLAAAASDRSDQPEPRLRLMFEVTWVVLGVALGGPIGFGTIMVAALIGPAVAVGHRSIDTAVVRSRRQVATVSRRLTAQAA
jgi:uncharacterized membrane protein YczE